MKSRRRDLKVQTCELNKKTVTPADFELLAPAGDICSFDTAIACGADAVYLGLSDFNARRKAENFSAENIAECVRRAHFYGVKVYVTVNTLVKDSEMPSLLSLVRTAVEADADAFIVQDMGVAECLMKAFPGIVLHASTQLGVHNVYGAKQAEGFGFKRVVLSRETKLEDIRGIRENTDLEIEFFVQGALCVAFSGNCYLSAKECGASGNRGLCKQLCRLPYTAELDGERENGYLLSAKDLCLANSLEDLISAGVTSFKIEGRMRRSEYVGSAVTAYRGILDEIKSRIECGIKSEINGGVRLGEESKRSLRVAYSRGGEYSERAYLDRGTPFAIEKEFNNHTGVKIGYVKRVKPFKSELYEITVQSESELQSGDGLKFFEKDRNGVLRETASAGLGDVRKSGGNTYVFVTKAQVREGAQVNLISSRAQNEEIKKAARRTDIDFNIRAVAGEPLRITARCDVDGKAVCVEAEGGVLAEAINAPTDEKTLITQVSKTGDSGFQVRDISAVADNAFVAKSEINALRRKVIEEMTEAIITARKNRVGIDESAIADICAFGKNSDLHARKIKILTEDDIKNGNGRITDIRELAVLRPSEYTAERVRYMLGATELSENRVALQLPVIANGQDIKVIEKLLDACSGIRTLVSENIYGLEFADRGYRVIAGAGHNALNAYAADAYKSLGASEVLPSIESGAAYNKSEIPLMTFAHCPYKTLFKNDCAHCTYKEGLTLTREKHKYRVVRTKVHNCYFSLFD